MLQEADLSLTGMALDARSTQTGDDTLLVKFYSAPLQNHGKSAEEGRPIFEEVDHIEIMVPGNKDSIIRRPASQRDVDRFPVHFQRYKMRTNDEHVEGTLLEEWPGISRSLVEELKFFNIRTLEQLIATSDANAQGIMGFHVLKQRAEAFLEAAGSEKAGAEIKALRQENVELKEQIASLAAAVEVLKSDSKPKPRAKKAAAKE